MGRKIRTKVNKQIDRAFHKYFKNNPQMVFIDGLFHILNEQAFSLGESLLKFVQYNFPELVKYAPKAKGGGKLGGNTHRYRNIHRVKKKSH